MRYVIGIAGLKRAGKDTFARVLRQVATERGFAFVSVAFADPLRQAAAAAYGVEVDDFINDAKKDTVCPEWGITYRQMLINLGEGMRSTDQDHWVKRWHIEVARAQAYLVECGRAIDAEAVERYRDRLVVAVPDVRRLNEAAAIHDASGVNVLVQRPGVEWNGHVTELLAAWATKYGPLDYEDMAQSPDLKHGTWHPVDPKSREVFDAGICNDGDVAALRPRAERVLDMVLKGAK